MGAHLAEELTRHQLSALVGEVSRGLGLHHPAKTRRTEASRPVAVYGTRRVSRPGELVQVDATPTTVAILGPLGVFVPAVILTAIDVYDRWFVALRVCVGAATSRDVCALIAQMGRPTVTRAGYPYELDQWHGIPELVVINDDPEGEKTTVDKVIGRKPAIHPSTIVFDHGSENASDHVMRYAAECGIDVVFCPPRRGHAKGIVESVHRMIGDVESTMPIHKGQNVLNRPVDLECDIPIKPQDLQDMLWEYVIDIYANEEHRSLAESLGSDKPLSPAMVWADYVTHYGEIDVPADPFVFLKGLESAQPLAGGDVEVLEGAAGLLEPGPVQAEAGGEVEELGGGVGHEVRPAAADGVVAVADGGVFEHVVDVDGHQVFSRVRRRAGGWLALRRCAGQPGCPRRWPARAGGWRGRGVLAGPARSPRSGRRWRT